MADLKQCKKFNSLGECIEWIDVGDKKVIQFRESAKKCNPKHFEEWKRISEEKKIKVMTE